MLQISGNNYSRLKDSISKNGSMVWYVQNFETTYFRIKTYTLRVPQRFLGLKTWLTIALATNVPYLWLKI